MINPGFPSNKRVPGKLDLRKEKSLGKICSMTSFLGEDGPRNGSKEEIGAHRYPRSKNVSSKSRWLVGDGPRSRCAVPGSTDGQSAAIKLTS